MDDHVLIFDAGSGIRALGDDLSATGSSVMADLFLSHFHWDHIQGLPFFRPLYAPATRLRVHGAKQGERDVQNLIAGQMGPVYFPVPFDALSAEIEFHDLDETPVVIGDAEVAAHRARHPTNTFGFRVRRGGRSIAFFPDSELKGGSHDMPRGWYDSLCGFLAGVDVLIHDAMYTSDEYTRSEGWGHSTFEQAVHLAEDAGVRRLMLFHHSPERTDAELDLIVDDLRNKLARRNARLEVSIATEGEDILLEELTP